MLRYEREDLETYWLPQWRKVVLDDGSTWYTHPNGDTASDLREAYLKDVESKADSLQANDAKAKAAVLSRFVNEQYAEKKDVVTADGMRVTSTTSTWHDYLHRGKHPLVAEMSLYVYCMWIYRAEKPAPRKAGAKPLEPVGLELPFEEHYGLFNSHVQRVKTEFTVPLMEGFTMPSSGHDSEKAAMFKQLLLRPLHLPDLDRDRHADYQERVLEAFDACMKDGGPGSTGQNVFTSAWLEFDAEQRARKWTAELRFAERYEWPSLWNTCECEEALRSLHAEYQQALEDYSLSQESSQGLTCADGAPDRGPDCDGPHPDDFPDQDKPGSESGDLDPSHCPDKDKPRAKVAEYVGSVGCDVAANLEALARARRWSASRAATRAIAKCTRPTFA